MTEELPSTLVCRVTKFPPGHSPKSQAADGTIECLCGWHGTIGEFHLHIRALERQAIRRAQKELEKNHSEKKVFYRQIRHRSNALAEAL